MFRRQKILLRSLFALVMLCAPLGALNAFDVTQTFHLHFSGAPTPPPGVFAVRVNMSGLEDNAGAPTLAELTYQKSIGVNGIRLPLTWAQMQTACSGPLVWGSIGGTAYNTLISNTLANAASLGMDVLLDLHNFGQDMNGLKIGSSGACTPADFANFWSRFVTFINADPNASAARGWDTMNE